MVFPNLVWAEESDEISSLVVAMRNGEKITIDLNSMDPESYKFEFFVREGVDSDKNSVCLCIDSYIFELEDVKKYTFEIKNGSSSTRDNLFADTHNDLVVSYKAKDILSIRGNVTDNICIIDISGKMCRLAKACAQDETEINVEDLMPGVYILTIDNQSIKFIKQ